MPHRSIATRPRRTTRGQPVFMREALPKTSNARRALAGELIKTTLSEVGKRFSEMPRREAEIARHADGLATCSVLISVSWRGAEAQLLRDLGLKA